MTKKEIHNFEEIHYAHFIIPGNPVSKSNFTITDAKGKKFMPRRTGKLDYDKYTLYEDLTVRCIKESIGDKQFKNGIIAHVILYYKYEKKHPDTNNMPKSVFDGIEKSELIINDVMVKHMFFTERYDKENPRVEIHLYDEEEYECNFTVTKKEKTTIQNYVSDNIAENKISIKRCIRCKNAYDNELLFKVKGTENDYICYYCLQKEAKKKEKKNVKGKVFCVQCKKHVDLVEAKKISGSNEYICRNCLFGG